jgi:hypothetical protein
VVVELLEQHEQQQCNDHPDGGFGKHIIHENSSDADASFPIVSNADFTRNKQAVPRTPTHEAALESLSRHYNGFLFLTRTNKQQRTPGTARNGFTRLTIRWLMCGCPTEYQG